MRAIALAAVILLAGGCLEINSPDGTIECRDAPTRQCPHRFYCAWNNRCYRDGHPAPPTDDLGAPDLPMWPDLSAVPRDLSVPDHDDLAMPADLASTD